MQTTCLDEALLETSTNPWMPTADICLLQHFVDSHGRAQHVCYSIICQGHTTSLLLHFHQHVHSSRDGPCWDQQPASAAAAAATIHSAFLTPVTCLSPQPPPTAKQLYVDHIRFNRLYRATQRADNRAVHERQNCIMINLRLYNCMYTVALLYMR